jgi:hypothetical protein
MDEQTSEPGSAEAPASPVPGTPPPMPQPPHVIYQVAQPVPANGLAVAGFVCGIVGAVLFWTVWGGIILGILGVIFGAVGLSKANGGAPNKGLAMAGLILGAVAVVGSLLFTIALVEAVNNVESKFAEVECAVTGTC